MSEVLAVELLTYERAFQELEKIVNDLENGGYTLNESMEYFIKGQELVKHCISLLDNADMKIQQLIGENLTDFEPPG